MLTFLCVCLLTEFATIDLRGYTIVKTFDSNKVVPTFSIPAPLNKKTYLFLFFL